MNPTESRWAGLESQALGRVVVPAGHDNLDTRAQQANDDVVEHLHKFACGRGRIKYVTRDEQNIHFLAFDNRNQLIEYGL
jgi:hypothetical protein